MYLKLSDSPCEVRLSCLDFVMEAVIRQWCGCQSCCVAWQKFTVAALIVVQEQSLGDWRTQSS